MESFYGGRNGAPFIITATYDGINRPANAADDLKFMNEDAANINYGEYVLIDTIVNMHQRSNPDNGKLFRRSLSEEEPFEYIGQIVGPKGENPEINMQHYDDIDGDKKTEYLVDSDIYPGSSNPEDNKIKIAWVNIKDEFGDVESCAIGFKMPYLVQNFNVSNIDYIEDINIEIDEDTKQPFYKDYTINIPKGVPGADISNLKVEPTIAPSGAVYYSDNAGHNKVGILNADYDLSEFDSNDVYLPFKIGNDNYYIHKKSCKLNFVYDKTIYSSDDLDLEGTTTTKKESFPVEEVIEIKTVTKDNYSVDLLVLFNDEAFARAMGGNVTSESNVLGKETNYWVNIGTFKATTYTPTYSNFDSENDLPAGGFSQGYEGWLALVDNQYFYAYDYIKGEWVKAGSISNPNAKDVNYNKHEVNNVSDALDYLYENVDKKMDKENPVGTGSFSLNRKADTVVGEYSFAEGLNTEASGWGSHAEGYGTTASGSCTHAEGDSTTASRNNSHAEGYGTTASGDSTHAEGDSTTAEGYWTHAEGHRTIASNSCSHAEGEYTEARGWGSHAEGYHTIANADYQHVQGKYNVQDYNKAFIIGNGTDDEHRSNALTVDWDGNANFAGDVIAHDSDDNIIALTDLSNKANIESPQFVGDVNISDDDGNASLSMGRKADTDVGTNSVALGYDTTASGRYSHAEGESTTASGRYSHAEGDDTTASNYGSHAEGAGTTARGIYSHAEGYETRANDYGSHAEGYGTITSDDYQHVQGKYNKYYDENRNPLNKAFIIGNGTDDEHRSNAFTVDWDGNVEASGNVTTKDGAMLERLYDGGSGANKKHIYEGTFIFNNGTTTQNGKVYTALVSHFDQGRNNKIPSDAKILSVSGSVEVKYMLRGESTWATYCWCPIGSTQAENPSSGVTDTLLYITQMSYTLIANRWEFSCLVKTGLLAYSMQTQYQAGDWYALVTYLVED